MRNDLLIRRPELEETVFTDVFNEWGISLTADTEDIEIIGKPVFYDYQFQNSNERDVIFVRDENDKVVRECAEINLNVLIWENHIPENTTMGQVWDDFVNYISGYILEIKHKAGGLQNTYTLEDELNPVISYNVDGSMQTITTNIKLKQTNAYNSRN